jgi:hypothetical protein
MSGSINSTAKSAAGVAWGHVALFAFLSYAIAWALILPSIPNVFDLIRADETPAEPDISIFTAFAMFAPFVAALVMRLFVSKEGLQGWLGPLRKWRFYGLALVLPGLHPASRVRPRRCVQRAGIRRPRLRRAGERRGDRDLAWRP